MACVRMKGHRIRVRWWGVRRRNRADADRVFGYQVERLSIEFAPGADVTGELALLPEAVIEETIRVVVGSRRLAETGFLGRQKQGAGTFLDTKKLEAKYILGDHLSDVLRGIRGIRVVPDPSSAGYRLQSTRGGGLGAAIARGPNWANRADPWCSWTACGSFRTRTSTC